MKKLLAPLIVAGFLLSALPVPAHALTCPAGEKIITDYSTETPTERCDGTQSVPANTPVPNMTTPAQTAAINGGWQPGAQCFTSFGEGTSQVSGTYDQNGNCITAQGPGGNSAVNGGQVMNAQGQFTQPYTPPAPAPATTNNSQTASKLTYTPLEPLPGGNDTSYNSISRYLNLMFNILLSIGAMIAVVTLVLGGVTYMVSEVVEKRNVARARIRAAFIGLGLLLTCWLILNTINPNLTKFYLPGIDQSGVLGGGSGSSASPTAASSVDVAQINQQQTACKAKGTNWAFYVGPGGQTYCTDVNQI